MRQRNLSSEQIILLARWLDTEPEVPEGKWFKKFPGFTVCGEGEFIKPFSFLAELRTDANHAAGPAVDMIFRRRSVRAYRLLKEKLR
ncbi:MAG: hypothetical protein IH623_13155 [Verrucomicrobia bacterium]|nr:hypothetical protein [Verrucomicrobiota bacterium]